MATGFFKNLSKISANFYLIRFFVLKNSIQNALCQSLLAQIISKTVFNGVLIEFLLICVTFIHIIEKYFNFFLQL